MNLVTLENTQENEVNEFLNQYCGEFLCGAITDDCQTLVTGGLDSAIRGWELAQKQQKFVLLGHNSDVYCIALTGDGQHIISGSRDASVRVWNLQQKSQTALLKGHKGSVLSICYLEKGSLIILGDFVNEIIVWDFTKHAIINKLRNSSAIRSLVLMKTQPCIIAGEGYNIAFFELETLKKQKTIQGHTKYVSSLALASDERIMVSGSWDYSIIIWDLIESKKISQLVGHDGIVNSLALTLDEQFIVSGSSDYSVRVWDMSNASQVFNHKGHSRVNEILRANRNFLSLFDDSGIGRLEIATGAFEVNWFLKPFECDYVDFSTESKLIGYGSKKEALVWDLERGAVTNVLLGHESDVRSVEISRDGQFALSCSLGK